MTGFRGEKEPSLDRRVSLGDTILEAIRAARYIDQDSEGFDTAYKLLAGEVAKLSSDQKMQLILGLVLGLANSEASTHSLETMRNSIDDPDGKKGSRNIKNLLDDL